MSTIKLRPIAAAVKFAAKQEGKEACADQQSTIDNFASIVADGFKNRNFTKVKAHSKMGSAAGLGDLTHSLALKLVPHKARGDRMGWTKSKLNEDDFVAMIATDEESGLPRYMVAIQAAWDKHIEKSQPQAPKAAKSAAELKVAGLSRIEGAASNAVNVGIAKKAAMATFEAALDKKIAANKAAK